MRVTHVITRLIVGGAQENTVASVLGLRQKAGLELRLISGPTFGPEGSLESWVAGHRGLLHIEPTLVRPVHLWKDLVALRRLTRLFRHDCPDIVHTHSGKAGILGRLAAARSGVPIIVHTIHGPSFGAFQGFVANSVFRNAERYASRFTSHFVVVADAMKHQYLAAGIGRENQYTRILSGFDLEPFVHAKNSLETRARFGIGAEEIVVGTIARLFKLKGHEDLFAVAPDIVARYPHVKFLLVGDGEWRSRFETLTADLGLKRNFIFTGLVEPAAVAPLVGIMDILVHLSSREGLARALPQALAAGKPVLAYDCDGAREVCLEGETGFLVQKGDLATLKERLFLLSSDSQLRHRLGDRGRSFVTERFGVQHMVDALHTLYLDLTQRRAGSKARSGNLASLSRPG